MIDIEFEGKNRTDEVAIENERKEIEGDFARQ